MNEVVLEGLKKKDKINQEDKSSGQETSLVEVRKEEQKCPNCHFSRLKKIDDEVICPICGYGHKRCG